MIPFRSVFRINGIILCVLWAYFFSAANTSAQNNRSEASNYRDQFTTGLYNYGFIESVYTQFTGYTEFDDGSLPSTVISAAQSDLTFPLTDYALPYASICWDHLIPLDFDMPGGFSIGFEALNFYATSDSYYTGTSDIVAPSVNMRLYFWTVYFKLFLLSPFDSQLQPYLGVGWGIINGDFDSVDIDGKTESYTTFSDGQSSRVIGIQLQMGTSWGGNLELRSTTAYANTSNDPFDQDPDSDNLKINFSGSMISATGYVRF